MPSGVVASARWKLGEAKNVWADYLNMPTSAQKGSAPTNANCERCHPVSAIPDETNGVRMNHELHLELRNLDCIDCHDTVSHKLPGQTVRGQHDHLLHVPPGRGHGAERLRLLPPGASQVGPRAGLHEGPRQRGARQPGRVPALPPRQAEVLRLLPRLPAAVALLRRLAVHARQGRRRPTPPTARPATTRRTARSATRWTTRATGSRPTAPSPPRARAPVSCATRRACATSATSRTAWRCPSDPPPRRAPRPRRLRRAAGARPPGRRRARVVRRPVPVVRHPRDQPHGHRRLGPQPQRQRRVLHVPRRQARRRQGHRRRHVVPRGHRRRRPAEEHVRRPPHPGELPARPARLRQLPHRLQRRRAPGRGHHGLAADRQARRLRRLPQRPDGDVRPVLPRQPGPHQRLRQGAALRRLPRRARHHPAGHPGVPRPADGDVRPLPRGRPEDVPRQLPRQGLPARLGRRPPSAASATAATRSCRPATRRARSPARTSSPPAPSATPAPTRTSPTSART